MDRPQDESSDPAVQPMPEIILPAWERLMLSPGPDVLAAARRSRRIRLGRYAALVALPVAALTLTLRFGTLGWYGSAAGARIDDVLGLSPQPVNQDRRLAAPPALEPRGDGTDRTHPEHPTDSARLLVIGKALMSIGQTADARAMLDAAARMGNAEAAAFIVTNASALGAPTKAPRSADPGVR